MSNGKVKSDLLNILRSFGHQNSPYAVFRDFITTCALAISNGWDKSNYVDREALYLITIKPYTPQEVNLFAKGFALLQEGMIEAPHDYLGEIFMELGLGSEWTGQFFTPMHVCRLMAKTLITQETHHTIEQNGFISVMDPCVGGGAMLIAFADELQKTGFNYPTQMYAVGQDIDIMAVYMSYVQLSLMGLGCRIIHGNSLAQECLSNWYSPWNACYGWEARYNNSQTINPDSQPIYTTPVPQIPQDDAKMESLRIPNNRLLQLDLF